MDDAEQLDLYYPDDDYDDDSDDECEAFGGVGCKHFGCAEWGGDDLCFAMMRAGYGRI